METKKQGDAGTQLVIEINMFFLLIEQEIELFIGEWPGFTRITRQIT